MTEAQRRELEFFGVVLPKEDKAPVDRVPGWKPEYPGQEPPF